MADPDPCAGGHDDGVDPELHGQAGRVQRCCAAKRDQRAAGKRLAALDRVNAGGIGHGLVDDLADARGSHFPGHPGMRRDVPLDRASRRVGIQRHGSAGEPVGIDPPEQQVGVGHRRPTAAAAVTRGTRLGADTLGANNDAPERIHASG